MFCLPFVAPHTQNRKDVNRISIINRRLRIELFVSREEGTIQKGHIGAYSIAKWESYLLDFCSPCTM